MKDKKRLKSATVAAFCLALAAGAAAPVWRAMAEGQPVAIAGTAPSERPVGAPRLTQTPRGEAWEKNAYKGVSKPYPPSIVGMLRDQGGWYTPFLRRGAPGGYDLRHLHDK